MAASAIRTVLSSHAVVATDYCTSDACLEAKKEEAESSAKSAEAANTALSYEKEVSRLNTELNEKQAAINASIARINTLTQEINEKIAALTEQKGALAEVLNDLNHDNETELILQIAGSKNITDLTEKQARANSIKNQIASYAEKIEETKQELEQEKADMEVLKQGQEREQAQVASIRNEQASLQAKYENDASSFAAAAEEARRIQAEEVAKAMEEERRRIAAAAAAAAAANGGWAPSVAVYTNAANDTYAYRDYCPQNDGNNIGWGSYFAQFGYTNYYGGYICECVSYAGYKAYEYWHGKISGGKEAWAPWNIAWGNAISWSWAGAAYGYHVSSVPVAHSVAVWPISGVGHVQWVEAVDENMGIYISEYNNTGSAPSGMYGDYGEDYYSAYEYQSLGFSFIYFD
ncbi:hypothetical protein IJ114_02000 [Candidatus Saccharibacteria bacterium]|nr:hypothetical protein [Candidatus Saccharibacteria bacterium]